MLPESMHFFESIHVMPHKKSFCVSYVCFKKEMNIYCSYYLHTENISFSFALGSRLHVHKIQSRKRNPPSSWLVRASKKRRIEGGTEGPSFPGAGAKKIPAFFASKMREGEGPSFLFCAPPLLFLFLLLLRSLALSV